jgi:hypothetical protein
MCCLLTYAAAFGSKLIVVSEHGEMDDGITCVSSHHLLNVSQKLNSNEDLRICFMLTAMVEFHSIKLSQNEWKIFRILAGFEIILSVVHNQSECQKMLAYSAQ